jgi:hypothetical protein
MKKLTDQELDSIFKNAAEGFESSFDSAAWDAMNAKLDQPQPTIWKKWMPFVLLGVVIFSTGVWVGTRLNENRQLTESILKSKSKESIQQKNTTARENQDQVQATPHQASVEKETTIEKQQQEVTDGKELNKTLRMNNKVVEKSKSTSITAISDPLDDSKFILHEVKNSNELINKVSDNPVVDTMSQQAAVYEAITDTVLLNSEEGKEKNMSTNRHPIYLRALASPDFSSINYASASETGSNYSLLLEYQLTNRWSISTGGIWSMKKYSYDQEVTYGKYTADRMVGACEILDIPVNVYYRFRPHLKTSFYAGIGFSSYIMLQEDYTYTVDYSSGSRDYSYTIERKNNEWFKMLNLSIGMQYQVAPRFYLQAEPFLKAPLAGVGEWDVQLSSMGIFLGVKYKVN